MNKKQALWILIPLLVVLLIVAGIFAWKISTKNNDGYQAVFLTNGQVYFGRITCKTSEYITFEDIYYLQLKQQLQDQKQGEQQQPDLTLIKLGNELHGPQDSMEINKDHVLFIEELKEDSKVVQAIKDYISK